MIDVKNLEPEKIEHYLERLRTDEVAWMKALYRMALVATLVSAVAKAMTPVTGRSLYDRY